MPGVSLTTHLAVLRYPCRCRRYAIAARTAQPEKDCAMLKKQSKVRVPLKLIYWVLAGLYAGAFLGLEKEVVAAIASVCYALAAITNH